MQLPAQTATEHDAREPYNRAVSTISREFTVSTSSATPAHGPVPRDAAALEPELAQVIVQALNLEIEAAAVDAAAPLYGEGLGLDSIDILELALEVSQRYGFQLRADDENNQKIFQSLRTLAAHVAQHRTR